MLPIQYIKLEKILGHKVLNEGNEAFETRPKKINIITGCNGSLKTAFLEALVTTMEMMTGRGYCVHNLHVLCSFLRGDVAWIYSLASDDLEMVVNGYEVRSIDADTLAKLGMKMEDMKGFALLKDKKLLVVNYVTRENFHLKAVSDFVPEDFRYITFYMPQSMTSKFTSMFTSAIDIMKAMKVVREVLGFETVYSKVDSLNRYTFYVVKDGKEVPIERLGRGMMNLVLLALASSNDVVIVDNVENSLHPQMMSKAIDIISKSDSQWFITTYSVDFIAHMLLERPSDVMLYQFEKKDYTLTIRQLDGEQARKVALEEKVDLRGNCYE